MPLPSPLVPEVVVLYAEKHRAFTRRNMERACRYTTATGRDSFPEKMQITGNNRGWLAETGSRLTAHTTTQSPQTACFQHYAEWGFCAGFSATHFSDFGLCGRSRVSATILGALSPHPKIPFPAPGRRREAGQIRGRDSNLFWLPEAASQEECRSYSGLSPSASNLRHCLVRRTRMKAGPTEA